MSMLREDAETHYESPYYEKVEPMWFGMLVVLPGKHSCLNIAEVSEWPPRLRPHHEEIKALMDAGMLLITQPNAWYDESVHTMTMQHVDQRFGHAMYPVKVWETDSLMTHYTNRSKRVSKAFGIDNSQILQGITDCCQFADVFVGQVYSGACRRAWQECWEGDVHRDIKFLRMVNKALEGLPRPEVVLKGFFKTGALSCPSNAHVDMLGGLPHLQHSDVADKMRQLDAKQEPPAFWNVAGTPLPLLP